MIERVHALRVLVVAGFRRHANYRAAMFGGAFTNSIFGLLRASIITAAVTTAGGELGGYAVSGAVTYAWLTQALIGPVHVFAWEDLALRIRTGDIAVDLARPLDVQLQYAAMDVGRAGAMFLPRGLPPLVVGALTFGLAFPTDPVAYLAGAVSVLLGIGVSFTCRYLLSLSAIWLLDVRGVFTVYVTVSLTLSGLTVPVHWFPGWLATLAAATPFPSMLQAPTDVLTGRVSGAEVPGLLGTQLAWLVGVLSVGRVVQHLGTRRLVVQGG